MKYRKLPIIFFPTETRGINYSRNNAFGDRIDHTLFDLKNYFSEDEEKRKSCKLAQVYNKSTTSEWLSKIGSYKNYIEWLGLKNIFNDNDYNVLDLEKK